MRQAGVRACSLALTAQRIMCIILTPTGESGPQHSPAPGGRRPSPGLSCWSSGAAPGSARAAGGLMPPGYRLLQDSDLCDLGFCTVP